MLGYLFLPAGDAYRHVGVLQGGCHVEKVGASERRCIHRSYAKSLATGFGMDAEWNNNRLCQRKSRRKSSWLGKSSFGAGT